MEGEASPLYGTAQTPNALVELLRARKNELNIADKELDEIAGLAAGYTGKLLGPARVKQFGSMSLFAMVGALGLTLSLHVDEEATRRVLARVQKRERNRPYVPMASRGLYSQGPLGRDVIRRVFKSHIRQYAKKGGIERAKSLSPIQRIRAARKAARARWAKWRIARRAERARQRRGK